MNLRGTVIPVIDLAARLGTAGTIDSSRSAIVVAEVGGSVLGLIVDRVSDILSIRGDEIQPLPEFESSLEPGYAHGIIPREQGLICFLNLDRMFANLGGEAEAA